MKISMTFIAGAALLAGCNSFNHVRVYQPNSVETYSSMPTINDTIGTGVGFKPLEGSLKPPVTPIPEVVFKVPEGYCKKFVLPKLPALPDLPITELGKLDKNDDKGLDDLAFKQINDLRNHNKRVNTIIHQAYSRYQQDCHKR